ncbi:hypothetical protein V6N13_108872 [Hibiscus sabdariffa]
MTWQREVEGDGFGEGFLELLANIFILLCWPLFTLIYPFLSPLRSTDVTTPLSDSSAVVGWREESSYSVPCRNQTKVETVLCHGTLHQHLHQSFRTKAG